MRILGIDPGLRCTGFGVVELCKNTIQHVASGVISIPTNYSISKRLQIILNDIRRIVRENRPDVAAVEIIFLNSNANSSLLLGQARGAALCALADSNLLVHEYTALQIKKALVGTGRARKEQVQIMVKNFLSLDVLPRSDSADALACAICHAHSDFLFKRISEQLSTPLNSRSKIRFRKGRLIR